MQNYWDLIRRGKPMPEIEQFNPGVVEDMWDQCMRLDAMKTQSGTTFICSFMGLDLKAMLGRDLTGQPVDKRISQYPYSVLTAKLDEVMDGGKIIIDENQFISEKNKRVTYRACIMPFGNESRGITHVIVAYSAREF